VSSAAESRNARWPWVLLGVFVLVAAVGMSLVYANAENAATQWPYVVAFTTFGVVGALITSRDRRNVIGFLLLYAAFMAAASFAASEATTWLISQGHDGLGAQLMGLINGIGWIVGTVPAVFLLPLLFPNGHLPSPRWRPVLWLFMVSLGLILIGYLLGTRTVSGSKPTAIVNNPLYVPAVRRLIQDVPGVLWIVLPVLLLSSLASVFVRFRHAHGIERQQIKWVAFGLTISFVTVVGLNSIIPDPTWNAVVSAAGFLAIPVSIGVAVLRFHLYDLDVVVRKAVVYGLLAAFATIVYLGLVVGLGAWLGRASSFLTMTAAVVVAVTFQPVRHAFDRFANRVVYGDRATPYEVLSAFSDKVGGAYEDVDVVTRMARVVGEGIGAERADVWLQVDRQLRDVAAWPLDAERRPPVALVNGVVPPIEDTDRVWPVEADGELLGALAVRKPPTDPLSPADEKLVADLARQAGLVLRNVQLTEELKGRLEELTAAQRRIVTAQDEARRRLERNIHDGAQQQLVALTVKARLARTLAERDPARAAEMLSQIETETQDALENMRDLARGIYPPLLADKGLVAALQAQARKSPVPVTVEAAPGVVRYPQDTEAAAYFCTLEALQNVAKYAGASRAEVHIGQDDGMLAFEVHDDGRGFDTATASGSGLQGMVDRLAAIGGTLSVASAPGSGTTVSGRIPVAAGSA
jgi:signal transduction histidine kinase